MRRGGIGVARGLGAILGQPLELGGRFLIQGRVRDLPAEPGMGEQALGDGRGLRHAPFMLANARARIEENQSGGNPWRAQPHKAGVGRKTRLSR